LVPVVKFRISPLEKSISRSSPVFTFEEIPSQIKMGNPLLIAFRKKYREDDSAMTAFTPAPLMAKMGCSILFPPPPKFRPAISTVRLKIK